MRPYCLLMTFAGFCAFASTANAELTSASIYSIKDDRIVFPDFDNRTTIAQPLLQITPEQFPDHKVHDNRILIASGELLSNDVRIPDAATTISMSGRSLSTMEVFPRLRVSMVTKDMSHTLYSGYWQTISLQARQWPIPPDFRGKTARLKIEFLNPATIEEQRTLWFHKAVIY